MTIHIAADALADFCAEVFERVGCSPEEARRVAASLVEANLTGHDSHGVIRMPRYVDWVRVLAISSPTRRLSAWWIRLSSPSSTADSVSARRSRRRPSTSE